MNDPTTPQLAQRSSRRTLLDDPARLGVFLTLLLAGLLVAIALDGLAYRHIDWPRPRRDLHNLFRLTGYLPTIVVLGAALSLIDRRHLPRACHILLSAAAAGLVAELLKAIVGRERPITNDGINVFKPFLHGFVDSSNLAFPSSHVAVAFGAAWMASLFYPRGRWLFLALAVGCALSRLAAKAHWLSDCYAAAVLAYLIYRALRPFALPLVDRDPL